MSNVWEDNSRPDGKRWACPYCTDMIGGGSFEMLTHLEVKHRVVKKVHQNDS